jgi:phosphocarrier protein
MVARRVAVIVNRQGLHARPSTRIVEVANRFQANITIRCGSTSANGKSVLSLLSLCAPHEAELIIEAEGVDEEQAVAAIATEIGKGFGELYETDG